jgi:hypothetical protein
MLSNVVSQSDTVLVVGDVPHAPASERELSVNQRY